MSRNPNERKKVLSLQKMRKHSSCCVYCKFNPSFQRLRCIELVNESKEFFYFVWKWTNFNLIHIPWKWVGSSFFFFKLRKNTFSFKRTVHRVTTLFLGFDAGQLFKKLPKVFILIRFRTFSRVILISN